MNWCTCIASSFLSQFVVASQKATARNFTVMLNLNLYLKRIAYQGPLTPNLATLTALHRAHLQTIIYENLDIHLGRAPTLSDE